MSFFTSRGVAGRSVKTPVGGPVLLLGALLVLAYSQPAVAADAAKPAATTTAAKKGTASRKVDPAAAAKSSAASKSAASAKLTTPAKKAPAAVAAKTPPPPKLSAEQIVAKHVAARGGQQSWRAVKTLSMSGRMDAGTGDSAERALRVAQPGGPNLKVRREIATASAKADAEKQVQLPFRLARERPNKSRLEIDFAGKTAVQVYDGAQGWKLRPFLNRNDVEPFTEQEARNEAESDQLDDPVMDAAAKGSKVEFERVEAVEGNWAYELKVTSKAGTVRHVWIDAKSFLDVKVEGVPRRMDGKMHEVFVYQRDFRAVQGLKIPFQVETVVDGYPQGHKIVVEKVAVNPKLDAATFAKPRAG
jgi:hypothetical protein